MQLVSLKIRNFRNLADVALEPAAGLNWLYGSNGAGKTSVLEAVHVLARGRSFRSTAPGRLIRDASDALRIVARTRSPEHRLGLERRSGDWVGRLDGRPCRRVSEFAATLPLIVIDPENHQLLEGTPALRRSFLDWGLFHVEPGYLEHWKRYARLLRQRNAALRDGRDDAVLTAIEGPMAEAAERIDQRRADLAVELDRAAAGLQPRLGFRLGPISLEYRGLAPDAEAYRAAWLDARARDREQGFTRTGPQRADLAVRIDDRAVGARLSRGQMKLAALLLKLAQLETSRRLACAPLLLIDDPVSELDGDHLGSLLDWLGAQPLQVWVSAVEPPERKPAALFHVEQGKIQAVV